MDAVRNDVDPGHVYFDVAMTIEDISTGQVLLNENQAVKALGEEQMTAERALNHCAREARNLIDGGQKLEAD